MMLRVCPSLHGILYQVDEMIGLLTGLLTLDPERRMTIPFARCCRLTSLTTSSDFQSPKRHLHHPEACSCRWFRTSGSRVDRLAILCLKAQLVSHECHQPKTLLRFAQCTARPGIKTTPARVDRFFLSDLRLVSLLQLRQDSHTAEKNCSCIY